MFTSTTFYKHCVLAWRKLIVWKSKLVFHIFIAVYSFIVFSYFPTSLNLWSPSRRSVLRGPSIHPIPGTSSKRRASTVVISKHSYCWWFQKSGFKKKVEVGSWNPVDGTQVLGISEPEPSTETNFREFFFGSPAVGFLEVLTGLGGQLQLISVMEFPSHPKGQHLDMLRFLGFSDILTNYFWSFSNCWLLLL